LSSNTYHPRYWAVVPAAGKGTRMAATKPKQYLKLLDKTIIEHSLFCLVTYPKIEKIVVVLDANDKHWSNVQPTQANKIITAFGGQQRSHSVLNGLRALKAFASDNDWVLVHDAVRPCLQHEDIDRLIVALADHPCGGLLGTCVRDTLKRTDNSGKILTTVDRDNVWQASTPQMFRLAKLQQALETALQQDQHITDEASAIELTGQTPMIVEGRSDNIKITHPQDLLLAEKYLVSEM